MKYKFGEDQILKDLKAYIDKTYSEHYAKGEEDQIQTFELIAKEPIRGMHFAVGNILKYGDRLGHKDGYNKADLLKIIHYGLLAMWALDKYNEKQQTTKKKVKSS